MFIDEISNMTIFTRKSDLIQYVEHLEKVILEMANTLEKISGFEKSEILYEYNRIAKGPNTLETILIEQEKYTFEEFKENWIEEYLLRNMEGD